MEIDWGNVWSTGRVVNCIPSGHIMIEVDHLAPNLRTQYAVQDLYSADQTDLPQESMCYSIHTDLMASQFQRRKKTDDCRNVMSKVCLSLYTFLAAVSRGELKTTFSAVRVISYFARAFQCSWWFIRDLP